MPKNWENIFSSGRMKHSVALSSPLAPARVQNKVAQTSASWLSGGLFCVQRQVVLQAAPSFGQPRPASANPPLGPRRPAIRALVSTSRHAVGVARDDDRRGIAVTPLHLATGRVRIRLGLGLGLGLGLELGLGLGLGLG